MNPTNSSKTILQPIVCRCLSFLIAILPRPNNCIHKPVNHVISCVSTCPPELALFEKKCRRSGTLGRFVTNGFRGDLADNIFSEIGTYPRCLTYQRAILYKIPEVLLCKFHFNLLPVVARENSLNLESTDYLAMGGIIEQGVSLERNNINCDIYLRTLKTRCKRPYTNRLSQS